MLISEGFQQPPLQIPPGYTTDPVFQCLLERILPPQIFQRVDQELKQFQVRLAGPIRQLASTIDSSPSSVEPTLTQYDQFGRRVDELKTSEGWRELKKVAVEEGMVSIAMERKEGEYSRIRSFAKGYLFAPDGLYVGCPISMTDGAARVIELAGTDDMKRDILPRLTSLDPRNAWIAGQWMTERTGGSDLGLTETVAHPVDPKRVSPGDDFILDGFKWFSSATDGDCALALARSGGEGSGSKGLSLFFVKLRDDEGKTNGVFVHRLKKKFGTKALPTAELSISNCRAQLVGPLGSGVRTISTVLNITRLHSAMSGVASLRRCLVMSKEYARTRHIAGNHNQLLGDNSMHTNALLKPELTHRALLHLVFGSIHLLGRSEALGVNFDPKEQWRLRLLTPVVKSFCAELSTTELPDLMASLGGQGYMSENQFGRLIADANVERIWEGTTSVLSLDVVRVILQSKGEAIRSFVEWSRSILEATPRNIGLDSAVSTTGDRLSLLQEATKRYLTKQADPRLSRPLLFLIGYIASTSYLFEQAIWSNQQGRPEAELDKWIVAKWVESGGVKSNVAGLKGLLKASEAEIKEGMKMERALVYGLDRSSKL